MSSAGNALTMQMKRAIRTVKPNARIYFDNLIAMLPDKSKGGLGSMAVRVE